MGKSTYFTGQPVLKQLLFYIRGVNIKRITKKYDAKGYVKKFDARRHLIAMPFGVIEEYHSIRELVIGMLSNAHKFVHTEMDYMIHRSMLSDANEQRKSAVFGDIYMSVYAKHCESLADSRLGKPDIKRLYAMDSTTIMLFKNILKDCGRLPKEGKRKYGYPCLPICC
jgi:hypothetical protein